MKIIYHCYGGTHSSVTAAAYHLGLLPQKSLRNEDLLAIPFFDTGENSDQGAITMMGKDKDGNEVFFLGRRHCSKELENILHGVAKGFNISPDQYRLVNVMPQVNLTMRLGGFLSRKLKWIYLGRRLVIWGTRGAYKNIVSLVNQTRSSDFKIPDPRFKDWGLKPDDIKLKRIIFFNDTAFPYAPIVAAIRSGWLPYDYLPPQTTINQILFAYTGMGRGDGTVYRFVSNNQDELCLALWSDGYGDLIRQLIESFLIIHNQHHYALVVSKGSKDLSVRIGLFLSKLPFFKRLSLYLIYCHLKKVYSKLAENSLLT